MRRSFMRCGDHEKEATAQAAGAAAQHQPFFIFMRQATVPLKPDLDIRHQLDIAG